MFSFFQTTSHILAPQRVSPISNYWLSVHVTALTFLSWDLRSYIVGEARRAEDRHLCPFLPCCTEPSLFCYRLHICPVALPKFICWNNLQCDGIWRWGLWLVIRSCRWSLYERDSFSYKRGTREIPAPFHHVRIQWEAAVYEPGNGLITHLIFQHLDHGLPRLQNYEEYVFVVYKPSNPWCYMIAAWMD